MSLPDAAPLEGFSLAELRKVVGRLVGEVRRLQSDNTALLALRYDRCGYIVQALLQTACILLVAGRLAREL